MKKEVVLQDLDILLTNAVESQEDNQNTRDSKECIDNIREYIMQELMEDKLIRYFVLTKTGCDTEEEKAELETLTIEITNYIVFNEVK